ncbi:MAG: nucleoid-associated protein [Saprospiraceae bacterium]|nr:nucleoid-associated protein [Saprospiraceae bacterium]
MLDFSNGVLEKLIVHSVGNKSNEKPLVLSDNLLAIDNQELIDSLHNYFITPFVDLVEYHSFANEGFENEIYQSVVEIFDNQANFQEQTKAIATFLYNNSIHSQIKDGDLFIAFFTNVVFEDELVDAIGIFKSENKQTFLQLKNINNSFSINKNEGIQIDKLDKGCLIFNTDKSNGYKICSVDKSNRSVEAQFWKDNFLNIIPCKDDYHYTKDFLQITKTFVTKQLNKENNLTQSDKIELLNRSVDYFKTNDKFEKEDFENQVFQEAEIINSFRNFDENFREKNELTIADHFEISPIALKKQEKNFKSVLKLDKNFHIYIHGDKELLEHGVDQDGRKFYKIYYQQES